MATEPSTSAPTAVIGTTTWGTTLALVLTRRGVPVRLWARTAGEADRLRQAGEHTQRLPGHAFPSRLSVTDSMDEALEAASAVIFAVPCNSLRENAHRVAAHLTGAPLVISACKGLERESTKRMTQVLAEELPDALAPRLCALSGPNLAREIAEGMPSSTVVAAADMRVAQEAQALLNSAAFRVYTNTDVLGVELAGGLKNIIALGAGISDGLQLGHNTKAAFLSRGLAEITRFGVAAGAAPLTFMGLAGGGDLIATCYSPLSRNRRVGEQIALGKTVQEAVESLGGQVAEGVETTPAVLQMARELGVEMPITETTYRVLFEGLDPKHAAGELMGREPRPE